MKEINVSTARSATLSAALQKALEDKQIFISGLKIPVIYTDITLKSSFEANRMLVSHGTIVLLAPRDEMVIAGQVKSSKIKEEELHFTVFSETDGIFYHGTVKWPLNQMELFCQFLEQQMKSAS